MFRTQVEIPHSGNEITFNDKIMSLGSCFAENIGKKLQNTLFLTDINPFGVLYNPLSISQSIFLLLEEKHFEENDIFKYKSLWQSFSHSSLFSDVTVESCLCKINSRLNYSTEFLKSTNFLLITFGTAWIFEEKKTGKVVSNCHKLPSNNFNRRRLTVNEIVTCYTKLILQFKTQLPDTKIILSVSPIRHWKDGAHENNVSKSTLLLAVNELVNMFENLMYFPSYEIQMDELRDYRFYASDMFHPSEIAIDYIWHHFSETYFSEDTLNLKMKIDQLKADFAHRPQHPASEEFQQFIKIREKRKQQIISENPFLKNRIQNL